ncbi:MAG: PrsW family intramembrane metalloprotease [Candidatus Thermoplasmatota archaeon]
MATPLEAALLLVLFTFSPPLLGVLWLRNAERSRPEPWSRVMAAFLYGAGIAVLVSGFAERYVISQELGGWNQVVIIGAAAFPVLPVIIAPFIEETSKALGLLFFRDDAPEPENGYVYGGAVGLGFAATENLLYVISAFLFSGPDVALVLGVYRGIATVALHASATAITGYGLWRFRFARGTWRKGLGLVLLPVSLATAILVHATYNYIASVEAGTLVAVAFAIIVFAFVHQRIRVLDRRS